MLRPAIFIPESKRLNTLLRDFRTSRNHIAMVVDEYGDIAGMVTVNDVMEAVIGRTQSSGADASPLVVTRDDGSLLVDGSLGSEPLREVMGVNVLPGEDEHIFHTAAGMTIAQFGRIPNVGEWFDWHGWRIEIVDLDGPRVDKLLLQRLPDDEAPGDDG